MNLIRLYYKVKKKNIFFYIWNIFLCSVYDWNLRKYFLMKVKKFDILFIIFMIE